MQTLDPYIVRLVWEKLPTVLQIIRKADLDDCLRVYNDADL